jgi:hypothetical protein
MSVMHFLMRVRVRVLVGVVLVVLVTWAVGVMVVVMVVVVIVSMSVVTMIVGVIDRRTLALDREFRRGDAGPRDPLRPDRVGPDGEAAQCAADLLERDAEVDQRSEDHVARGAGEAVEVERGQTCPSYPANDGSSPASVIEK